MIKVVSKECLSTTKWNDFDLLLYASIEEVAAEWDRFMEGSNIFLSSQYLSAMEKAPPEHMTFYYVLVRDSEDVVGVMYFQLDHFNARSSLNYSRNGGDDIGKSSIRKAFRDFVAQKIDFYTLVCGNTTISGEHGYHFDSDMHEEHQLKIVDAGLHWVKDYALKAGYDVQLLFVKDSFRKSFSSAKACNLFPTYNEFSAQPGMEMQIRPDWSSFEDYMLALTSKYRVRVRRARKKLGEIEIREMDIADIRNWESDIYKYYRAIADKASFNLFILNVKYFSTLKEALGRRFKLFGCFEDNKLVAFYSIVENGDQLEAHFLGYREELNRERQLYLNMLLNIVNHAILNGFESIFFARTAMEIKSSVGAEPRDMYFYLQHLKGLHNKLLPQIYTLLDPKEDWVAREPFREA